jgi:hypothetical protein
MDSSPVKDEIILNYNECMECLEECEPNGCCVCAAYVLGCCMKPAQIMKTDARLWQERKQEKEEK